ncbi:hypothetical protein [Chitinophaga sancti]|uniref:Uncharacterized protein n=1 Tax=Chitinophaga sancti TaxID=1004 RepID=A0ABZ0XI23_9BACT|nr:hypothetical protein [Chitinophaga sancti]WQD64261.1 hypothetical protein U0033_07630 [Chitinophaga sancti]WQG90115.1 hypothetical protein SR876_01290 [Chitinophaga sancti]
MLAPKLPLKQRKPLAPKNNPKNQHISTTVAKKNPVKNATITMIVEAVKEVLAGAARPVLTR